MSRFDEYQKKITSSYWLTFWFWKTKCLFRQEKGLTLAYSTSSKNYSPTSIIEHTGEISDNCSGFNVRSCPLSVGDYYSGAFKTISKNLVHVKLIILSMVLQGLHYFNPLILCTQFFLIPISPSPLKVFYPADYDPWTKTERSSDQVVSGFTCTYVQFL